MDEKRVARRFAAKGYKYAVQFKTILGKPFGDPFYFKTAGAVGPFMRANKLEMTWTKPIEEMTK